MIGRRFGRSGFGVIGTAWALFNIALPIVQYSPELAATRTLAHSHSRVYIIGQITALKLQFAVASILVLSIFALVFYRGLPAVQVQIIAQSMLLLTAALSFDWVFQAFQHFEINSSLRCLRAIVSVGALFVALRLFSSTLVAPIVDFIALLVSSVLAVEMLRRWHSRMTVGTLTGLTIISFARHRRAMTRHGLPVIKLCASSFSNAVSWSTCIPIAGLFITAEQVGVLAAAVRTSQIVNSIFMLAIQLFFPILVRSRHTNKGKETTANLLLYSGIAAGLVYCAISVFARSIMTSIFGPAFEDATVPLRLISLVIVPSALGAVYGYTLLAANQDRVYVQTMTAGAVASSLLNCVAFWLWPTPASAALLVPVALCQTAILAYHCHRANLVAAAPFGRRRLRLTQLRALLAER
jgi:O-antigen/teichoic acid export membrane protein